MSDEPSDAQDSVLHTLMGRLRNPFYGAFVLAWIAIHWEAFYVTFFIDVEGPPVAVDGERYFDKLAYINSIGYTWLSTLLAIGVALVLPSLLQWVGGQLNFLNESIQKNLNTELEELHKSGFGPKGGYARKVNEIHALGREILDLKAQLATQAAEVRTADEKQLDAENDRNLAETKLSSARAAAAEIARANRTIGTLLKSLAHTQGHLEGQVTEALILNAKIAAKARSITGRKIEALSKRGEQIVDNISEPEENKADPFEDR